ncbi:hypothetical protein, partial [Klebsiella pneumoniae]|uniref:hypothetical protein n=1 Tax=Klebsiella pneumoniae TaxID=573 RepID=UPI003711CEE7
MRSIAAVYRWGAVLVALAAFETCPARAEPPADAVACVDGSKVAPDALIGGCTAVIDAPAASDAVRVAALLVRAVAFDHLGQTANAMGDLDRAIMLDATSARAYRLRGEMRRYAGSLERALT